MGPLHIALIAVNIIVPLIIWRTNSHEHNQPIDFKKFEATLERVASANGGSSCPPSEVAKDISKLCVQSDDKWKETATSVLEQVEGDFLVSCEVRDDGIAVSISPAQPSGEPACTARDTGGVLSKNPAFLFEHKGTMHSISFDANDGERQFITIANCRVKLKRAKKIKARSIEEFESKLGSDMDDPADGAMGNHMCLVYDPALGWNFWRRKFKLIKG